MDLAEHNGELIATEACQGRGRGTGARPSDHIASAQAVGQTPGKAAEQKIAGIVAEGVVDQFEAVEIEEQDRAPVLIAASARDGATQYLFDVNAVRQIGHAVEEGKMADPFGVVLKLAEHAIERRRQHADLVIGSDLDLLLEASLRGCFRAGLQQREGARDPAHQR